MLTPSGARTRSLTHVHALSNTHSRARMYALDRNIHRDAPPLEVGEQYWQFREAIVRCELFVIRMLGFNLRADLPHTYLAYHLRR